MVIVVPQPNEQYEHYKGNIYEIITLARIEATLEIVVIYRDISDKTKVWSRPLKEFQKKIVHHGILCERFKKRG